MSMELNNLSPGLTIRKRNEKNKIRKVIGWIITIFIVLGLGASTYLIYDYFVIQKNNNLSNSNNGEQKIYDKPILKKFSSLDRITTSSKFDSDWDMVQEIFFESNISSFRRIGSKLTFFVTDEYNGPEYNFVANSWKEIQSHSKFNGKLSVRISLPNSYYFIDETSTILSNEISCNTNIS